ncbi:MAG: DUF6288 domain-containing protein [Planctomycetota bacterium]|jgi:hypothetical protein
MKGILRIALVGITGIAAMGSAAGQKRPTHPGRGDDFFNLGPTGASGLPLTGKAARAAGLGKKAAGIRVEKVAENTPAFGRLQKGDILMAAGGRPFPPKEDPILVLSRAIERAEGAKTPELKLNLLRDGKPESVTLTVQKMGKHSRTCPAKCAKCEAIIQAGLQFLVKTQTSDGSFPAHVGGLNAKVAVTTLAGLAFCASGSTPDAGPYASPLKKAVGFLMQNAGKERKWAKKARESKGNWSQVNWNVGYAPWLLAEAYKATGDSAVLKKIEALAQQICKNQERSGGWAHGPGGPNALNYVELEIVSNFCLTSLGLAKQLGVEVPQETRKRSTRGFSTWWIAAGGTAGWDTARGGARRGWGIRAGPPAQSWRSIPSGCRNTRFFRR